MNERILQLFKSSIQAKENFLSSQGFLKIQIIAERLISALEKKNKILICGNGGSASDALHFAAELVGRFEKNRMALPAIALNSDVASITAISNDFGYETVFARQVEALGKENDVLIGISTSGNSENVIKAMQIAKKQGLQAIGLLGRTGGKLRDEVDIALVVKEESTARIQEIHITIIHVLCDLIENYFALKGITEESEFIVKH